MRQMTIMMTRLVCLGCGSSHESTGQAGSDHCLRCQEGHHDGPDAADGDSRRDVPVGLHSDFPMAPAEPLFLAWTAASRETMSGKVFAPSERLTLDQAIRAITIDAAYVINMETQVGSIEAGKLADFAVLDKDPYEVGIGGLRDIHVWGTVFEGKAYPARTGSFK